MGQMVADDTSRSAEVLSGRGWWKPQSCTAAPGRRRSGHVQSRVDTTLTTATRLETWRRRGCATDAE